MAADPHFRRAVCSTARTIFTYQPQRQMLPLIHSRISSGEPV